MLAVGVLGLFERDCRCRKNLCLNIPLGIGFELTYLVRASTQQPRLYVGMVLILIFAEVLGLYGVIVSILMITKSTENAPKC